MMRIFSLPLLFVLATSSPAFADDNESSLEQALRDRYGDNGSSGKAKGRPDNPGEHGRENAAQKQSRGHGNGSKQEDSWEDRVRGEFEDEDKDKDRDKKDKKKDKDKKKNKDKKK